MRLVRENAVLIVVLVLLVAGFVLLRSSPSEVGSAQELGEILAEGRPVLVYLYSNA